MYYHFNKKYKKMIIRTFIDKSNTIVEGHNDNFGLTPVCGLHYGTIISRFLLHFDIENIKKEYENGNISIEDKTTHTLKMTNCGSFDERKFNEDINGFCGSGIRRRATSFEVMAFPIPCEWDGGIGFDSTLDFWFSGKNSVSTEGSNWEYAYNGKVWPDSEGIYNTDFLFNEYDKFMKGEESIIIARQHFDYGNEDLELDITKYIQLVLNGTVKNNGICIAMAPFIETIASKECKYVGFFNNNTNTFFEPYIETRCEKQIIDNRFNFVLGKENKLLFMVNLGGKLSNLDELPICTIEEKEYPVKRVKNGIYEATVNIERGSFSENTILYDVWSNIKVGGETFDDVEMEFSIKKQDSFFSFGKSVHNKKTYSPMVLGVNDMEKINQGEIREVKVYFKEEYTNNSYDILDSATYRIYVKDGKKEIDVISDYVEQIEDYNVFYINTNEMLPSTYFVDIVYEKHNEIRVCKNILEFEIVNNATKRRK